MPTHERWPGRSLRRRRFLQVAGAAVACTPLISCQGRSSPWRFLTAEEARTLQALCEQIIPSDDTPGAAWAGVVNYIDLQLSGPFRKLRPRYRSGLAAIKQSCAGRFQKSFTELQPDRQTEFLSTLDRKLTPFFNLVIAHTMQGYYGDPRHGANRDAVSWRMLGVPVIPIRGRSPYQFPPQGIGS